jgi:serine/threonine protein kinase/Flp pilus assembly protein TadD
LSPDFLKLNEMIGQLLDNRYQITAILAAGGFGQTYKAADTRRPGSPTCVVKQLKPQRTDPAALDIARRLFWSEAETLEQLGRHPQIPQLLAYFEDQGQFYLVQELIDGHPLSVDLPPQTAAWPEARVIQLLQELLPLLSFVHSQEVIHRDIKPDNLIRRRSDGRLVLIDFGTVKQVRTQLTLNSHGSFTVAVGTPGYMPGEQAVGKPRYSSDLYAAGMVAIQALTGVMPDQLASDPNTGEVIWRDRIQVSPQFAAWLDQMIRDDFRQRYASADQALIALQSLGTSPVTTQAAPTIVITPAAPTVVSEPSSDLPQTQPPPVQTAAVPNLTLSEALPPQPSKYQRSPINFLFDLARKRRVLGAIAFYLAHVVFSLVCLLGLLVLVAIIIPPPDDDSAAWLGESIVFWFSALYSVGLTAAVIERKKLRWFHYVWVGMAGWLGFYLVTPLGLIPAFFLIQQHLRIAPEPSSAVSPQPQPFPKAHQQPKPRRFFATLLSIAVAASLRIPASYRRAQQIQSGRQGSDFDRAVELYDQGEYADAEVAIQRFLADTPDSALGHNKLGNILFSQSQYSAAESAYQWATQLDPDEAVFHGNVAGALNAQGQFEQAETSARRAIELDNQVAFFYSELGTALEGQESYDDAAAVYRQAIDQFDPEETVPHQVRLGFVLGMQERYQESESVLKQVLELDPNNARAYNELGVALSGQGRDSEAEFAYRRSLELEANNAFVKTNLAVVLANRGQYSEAEQILNQAIELNPNDPRTHSTLGFVLEGQGQPAAAAAAYRRAEELSN